MLPHRAYISRINLIPPPNCTFTRDPPTPILPSQGSWHNDPHERPSFKEIADKLDAFIESTHYPAMAVPTPPTLKPPMLGKVSPHWHKRTVILPRLPRKDSSISSRRSVSGSSEPRRRGRFPRRAYSHSPAAAKESKAAERSASSQSFMVPDRRLSRDAVVEAKRAPSKTSLSTDSVITMIAEERRTGLDAAV